MPRSHSKHDRTAFIACTALALAIVAVMWALSVRSLVVGGLAGTREMLSSVASTASEVKRQTAPDQEAIDAVRAGFKAMLTSSAEEEEGTDREEAVSAAAEIMAKEFDGSEESGESKESEDLEE